MNSTCTWDRIRPVLECSSMVSFMFWGNSPLYGSREMIQDVARSWPRLKLLRIESREAQEPSTRATIQDLRLLVRHCPRLQHLSFTFNTFFCEHYPHTQWSSTSLRTLDVQWTQLGSKEKAKLVRRQLEKYWPSLEKTVTWRRDSHPQLTLWQSIGGVLDSDHVPNPL